MVAACQPEIAACQNDAACASYVNCLLDCPLSEQGNADPACDEACVTSDSSESQQARADLSGCRLYGEGAACEPCDVPTTPKNGPVNQICEPRPPPRPPNPCRECFWEHCCDTWDACFDGDNPDCSALATCMSVCSSAPDEDLLEPCVADCFIEHPASTEAFTAQTICALSECTNEDPQCDEASRDECDTCLLETCADSLHGLMSTEEGFLVWMCLRDCAATDGGPGCVEDCTIAHPDAKDDFLLWGECIDYLCAAKC